MKPRDNRERLVKVPARFPVAHAQLWVNRPMVNYSGHLVSLAGSGGVAVGLHSGMRVDAVVADHIMPGISLADAPASAHGLACVGNRVRTAGGDVTGVIAGKRGGLAPGFLPGQFLGVEVPDDILREVVPGTDLIVETFGRGLAFRDWPDIAISNSAPRVLDALDIKERASHVSVRVRAEIPGEAAGAGLGSDSWIGDLEIAVDKPAEGLRFGDLIAFRDIDSRTSRFMHSGYLSVGVVSHGPSPVPGHGVGVTILLSGLADRLRVDIDPDASLAPDLLTWSSADADR